MQSSIEIGICYFGVRTWYKADVLFLVTVVTFKGWLSGTRWNLEKHTITLRICFAFHVTVDTAVIYRQYSFPIICNKAILLGKLKLLVIAKIITLRQVVIVVAALGRQSCAIAWKNPCLYEPPESWWWSLTDGVTLTKPTAQLYAKSIIFFSTSVFHICFVVGLGWRTLVDTPCDCVPCSELWALVSRGPTAA